MWVGVMKRTGAVSHGPFRSSFNHGVGKFGLEELEVDVEKVMRWEKVRVRIRIREWCPGDQSEERMHPLWAAYRYRTPRALEIGPAESTTTRCS